MTGGTEHGPHGSPRPWTEELLGHLRPTARDLSKVIDWLATTVRGEVALLDGTGRTLAGEDLPLDGTLVADLLAGRISSAALQDGARHVRLVVAGRPQPAAAPTALTPTALTPAPTTVAVLAVARPVPFDRHSAEIVTHTAGVLELLLRERELTVAAARLKRAAADLRLAILQLLMVEDTVSARRVAAGLWPGLLDTDAACVYVVESRADLRDHLAEQAAAATEGQALVVRCPAVDGHVIVVAPGTAAADGLRAVVARHPGVFLGGSTRQSLARTAAAYGQAISALAVARVRPDKAAVYAERTHPERLMDPAALAAWAACLLRPLDVLPHHTRAELLATTRLGLEFTAVSAAKVLGVSRNTVRARMDRVETMLRTDFSDLRVRAAVHLALNTEAAAACAGPDRAAYGTPGAVRLGDLLDGAAVRFWAHGLLESLAADGRNLRRTLRAWIAADGNAERAAQDLGVHPQTVREHVRGAEPVLERQLLASGSDLYEVVVAHLAAGDLDAPDFGNPDQPDSFVHE
ncbi:helix-turn-helix domain-containing protein [Streptomyces sp. NPDC047000]|uniref:helix-turn-helix domain-containing protein n=1 Tax=Streptomyces sp. NPDC047000 TaxID=3155474 RepID=UPI0033F8081F